MSWVKNENWFNILKKHENAGKHPVIHVLIKDHYESYRDQLPVPVFTDTDDHFVLAVY